MQRNGAEQVTSKYPVAGEYKYDDPRYLAVAKQLSLNSDLVERYRKAIASLPEDRTIELDPDDENVARANQLFCEVLEIIRQLQPQMTGYERGLCTSYFARWAAGKLNLD